MTGGKGEETGSIKSELAKILRDNDAHTPYDPWSEFDVDGAVSDIMARFVLVRRETPE